MAEDTRTSDGLESDVYIYPASTKLPDDDQVPTGEHDSEDEPLSTFRSHQRKEVSSSDQSDEEPLINKRRRMDQRTAAPDTLTPQNLCNRAKKESLQEAKQREEELLIHQASLDNVLAANGFVRVPITADGNCFFEAAVTQIEDVTSTELRSNLCDLLEEHQQEFINFFENADGADANAREMSFQSSVQDLRCEGRWCSNVADLLPLALAEWTQRQVTIFTSNENKPKIDVTPLHNPSAACIQPDITLALFQCYPQHYDACVSVSYNIEQTSGASVNNLSDIPQNISRDCSSSVTDQSPPIDTSQTPPASPGVPQRQSTPRK